MTGWQPCGMSTGSSSLGTEGISIPPDVREEDSENCVEHDHEEDRLNDRGGSFRPDFLAVALDQHPLEAAGQCNDEAEDRRFDHADPHVGHRNDFVQALDVGPRWNLQAQPNEESAA